MDGLGRVDEATRRRDGGKSFPENRSEHLRGGGVFRSDAL